MGYIRKKYAKLRPLLKKLIKVGILLTLFFFILSITSVILFRWIPVYFTPLMALRSVEYTWKGKWVPINKTWVPIERISPYLQKSIIASEDPKFLIHNGFDFEAIARAIETNKNRKVKVGASTITQQTAKNVFLYPARTYVRKALEAYFTILIEIFWDKKRILEVYLNVVELGSGIYGAEAASQYFWKKPSLRLTRSEAEIFAAILPNPRRWNPKSPTNFVNRRRHFIRRNIQLLGSSYFNHLGSW
jgi:monofunctional glycosyltransferase